MNKTCPICLKTKGRFVTKHGEQFVNEAVLFCGDCQAAWLADSSVRTMSDYYESNTFSQEFRHFKYPTAPEIRLRESRAEKRLRLLTAFDLIGPNSVQRVLEIGCSFGALLKLVQTRYPKSIVSGLELSTSMVEFSEIYLGDPARVKNAIVTVPLISDLKPTLVLIYQVIEHIEDIRGLLDVLSTVEPASRIVIEFPDLERALTLRKRLGLKYFQRSHLYDFSAYALSKLLGQHGIYIEKIIYGAEFHLGDKNTTLICSTAANSAVALKKPRLYSHLILKSALANQLAWFYQKLM